MSIFSQVIFGLFSIVAIFFFSKRVKRIFQLIKLGRQTPDIEFDPKRIKNLFLLALGQKKMFNNPVVAIFHLFLYVGFIIINVELIEILLDGLLGTHRLFLKFLGNYYALLINLFEILALLVIIACIVFIMRRNVLKISRLIHNDLSGFPKNDANFILITEIILMSLFLLMNTADLQLQARNIEGYHSTPSFVISGLLMNLFNRMDSNFLIIIERSSWWLHIIGIYSFLNYLPWSKHLHILMAFPNAYYARLEPKGKMQNMPLVQNEVLYAMQPELAPSESALSSGFGAKDIRDLHWHNLMDAFSCTECGRCTAACPASITGKKLSPRKIMMSTRDRMEELGKTMNENGKVQEDGKTLLHDYISEEELRACTTCNACVEVCPVSISPLEIIFELRRSLIMEESKAPQEWNSMFNNIENNFSPWKFSPDDRGNWTSE